MLTAPCFAHTVRNEHAFRSVQIARVFADLLGAQGSCGGGGVFILAALEALEGLELDR